MKNILFIVTAVFLLSFLSCKKEQTEKVEVVRDCTGTYLRFDLKEYRVCNLEKVDSFPDGAMVEATFVKKNECNGSAKDAIVCAKFHQNDGWIRVDEIKR